MSATTYAMVMGYFGRPDLGRMLDIYVYLDPSFNASTKYYKVNDKRDDKALYNLGLGAIPWRTIGANVSPTLNNGFQEIQVAWGDIIQEAIRDGKLPPDILDIAPYMGASGVAIETKGLNQHIGISMWGFQMGELVGIGGGNNPPNVPSNPNPANEATGISTTPTLSWTGGDPDPGNMVIYNVCFGMSGMTPQVSNQMATSYAPGTLSPSTTYYWQIVARDNVGAATIGPTWSFMTGTAVTTFTISGLVTTSGGGGGDANPLAGVTLTLTGAASATTTTDSNGNYTFTGLANGSYTVTPSLSGYVFNPTSQNVTVNNANVTGQNFTGTLSYSDY